ncbi:MAG: phosphoglycerate kinase [Parachlamydiales bacterium]|nr:phosphoglycerate kinase [Parachlamydiales bacterium]
MQKLKLKDLDVRGKRVLMRVDFNVPMEKGHITDDSRIRAALPSIEYVLSHGGSLILMSHLGRPKAKPEKEFSLAPCAKRLSELIKKPVAMAGDCVGTEVEKMAKGLKSGEILMLENLRFHSGEEAPDKDPAFVKSLAALGDCYVNDAFGTAHRAHASTAAIAKFFPNASAMGFLIEKEVEELSPLLTNPKRPFYAIIGGAKISTKIGVIKQLLQKVDALFIGGGMVYTFLKAGGIDIGASICENTSEIESLPRDKLRLPKDLVIADRFANDAKVKTVLANENIPPGWQGMDIGPQTIQEWSKELQNAATVFWNGPLGVFEMPHFANGTHRIAECLANAKAKTIIGGGDSVAAIEQMGLQKQFAHLSTGGGASLEFLEFGHLPGIDALTNK